MASWGVGTSPPPKQTWSPEIFTEMGHRYQDLRESRVTFDKFTVPASLSEATSLPSSHKPQGPLAGSTGSQLLVCGTAQDRSSLTPSETCFSLLRAQRRCGDARKLALCGRPLLVPQNTQTQVFRVGVVRRSMGGGRPKVAPLRPEPGTDPGFRGGPAQHHQGHPAEWGQGHPAPSQQPLSLEPCLGKRENSWKNGHSPQRSRAHFH